MSASSETTKPHQRETRGFRFIPQAFRKHEKPVTPIEADKPSNPKSEAKPSSGTPTFLFPGAHIPTVEEATTIMEEPAPDIGQRLGKPDSSATAGTKSEPSMSRRVPQDPEAYLRAYRSKRHARRKP